MWFICQHGIIEGRIARPRHAAVDVVCQERPHAPAAFPGGIPAGADAGIDNGRVRPHQAGRFQGAGRINQHLCPVREDEKGAFSGGGVDEMDVEHPFRPGGEGMSKGGSRNRLRPAAGTAGTASGTAAGVDNGRIGVTATGAAAGREKQPGKGEKPDGQVLFHCRCLGKGMVYIRGSIPLLEGVLAFR